MSNIGHVDVECPVCGNDFPVFLRASTDEFPDGGVVTMRITVDQVALADEIEAHRAEHHPEHAVDLTPLVDPGIRGGVGVDTWELAQRAAEAGAGFQFMGRSYSPTALSADAALRAENAHLRSELARVQRELADVQWRMDGLEK